MYVLTGGSSVGKTAFATNLAKSVASWKTKSKIKIIPEGLWLGSRNWLLTLSLEYYGIDFYKDQSIVGDYKKKYLKQYYSNLKQANI